MPGRVSLYEFLGVDVPSAAAAEDDGSTVITATMETYDDDPGLGSLATSWQEYTVETRQTETYDDDPGVEEMGNLSILLASTEFTKVHGETHDDNGVSLQFDT